MRKSILFITIVLISILVFGLNWVMSNGDESGHERRAKFDHRIDNIGFWMKMAEKGYTPYNPDIKPQPAVFTGSRIEAFSVLTEDSPDVPVTEINSTQSENSVFIDPMENNVVLNSNNSTNYPLVSGQDLLGANDLFSFDAGETWEGEKEGAGVNNGGDPTTAIGLNGRWFVNYITSAGGQGISYSDDQGATWINKNVAPNPGKIADKNHMWIDNSDSSEYIGNIYIAWTEFSNDTNDVDYGNIMLSRSTTNGFTWSSKLNISGTTGGFHQGVHLQTGPEGQVYGFYSIYDQEGGMNAIGMSKSLDGGETWETRRIIENIRGIRELDRIKTIRVNDFPVSAVDISYRTTRGNIYVVWANIGEPGINVGNDLDIYMIRSSDKGITWSAPIRINQDEPNMGHIHFFPWISCDPVTGSLSAIFYDDRNVDSSKTEVFCANSQDGSETWEDFKVSDVAFTPSPIPGLASGYMGDYLGISSNRGRVYPVWTDNRLGYTMSFCSPYEFNALKFPQNLTGSVTFETGAANLAWSFDEDSTYSFLYFNIYLNGSLLDTTTDTTYAYALSDYGLYHFMITAFYEENMESSAAKTNLQWGNAHIDIAPMSLYEHLTVDSMSTRYLKVVNTGQLDLIYNISTFVENSRSTDDYCEAKSSRIEEYISHVSFGDIDNHSGSGNYTDYTDLSTNLSFGDILTLTVTNGKPFDDDQCGAWIDWNQNEVFDDGMIAFEGSPGRGPYVAQVSPPLGAKTGSTRLRIRLIYTGELDPCGTSLWGEVEDYTVNVTNWLNIDPVYDTIPPGDSSMIAVSFDATNIEPGIYNATATFFANDPNIDQIDVPLTMLVSNFLVKASAKNNHNIICSGNSTQLIATPHGEYGTPTYHWTSDPEGFESTEQSPVIAPDVTTWYYVTMTTADSTSNDSTLITVKPSPVVELGADTTICGNDQILLDAGDQGFIYQWSTGENTQTVTVDSTTLFEGYGDRELSVTVYANNKCFTRDTIVVDVLNCTGIEETNDRIAVNIYPNPNYGQFWVDFNTNKNEYVDVFIVNQLGKIVFEKEKIDLKKQKTLRVDLKNSTTGAYQLFIRSQKEHINKKIVVK